LVNKYDGTIVLVSHDRIFVNNTVTDIVHFFDKKLTYYPGNYDAFEKVRQEKLIQLRRTLEAQDKKKRHIQAFIDRFRYNANRARLVQSRIKTLERLAQSEDFVTDIKEDPTFRFEFPEPEPLKKEIVSVDDVCFNYSKDGPLLLKNLSLRVDTSARIGVLGRNGSGKTTLMKLLAGDLEPTSGTIFRNLSARISVFAQHHVDQLDLSKSALELMMSTFPSENSQDLRNHLGRFGVSGDLAIRRMSALSGGQKSRVSFALSTFINPHLLILDEPTVSHM